MSDPDETAPSPEETYEGGFDAVVARMDARRAPLSFAKGESLPPVDVEFAPLKQRLVTPIDVSTVPKAKAQSGHQRKLLELTPEFEGLPELCHLHALLIAHLRKSEQPAHTMELFERIWREESEFLFQHLDPRWLVSAITTFGDHGTTDAQRRVGQSMTVLFSTMKLYESERLYSGFAPEQEFKLKRLVRKKLPLNMDRFALVAGGLDVNMLGRLWQDAREDATIAPLAHRLLSLLNQDHGTVFRRLKTLRGRKLRQRASSASTDPAEPEPAIPARARRHDWAVVSTIKASANVIAPFVAHHLALGAAHMYLYLDAPLRARALKRLSHPKVSLITCDDTYWQASGKARMDKHQQRQAFNATTCYRSCAADWLAHIDVDEFLHSSGAITDQLARVSDTVDAVILPPAEEIAQSGDEADLFFRRTYFDADCPKSVVDELYPTFGRYLRSGFISHTAGKTMARTGLSDVRFGVHLLKRGGQEVKAIERSKHMHVLHRHAPSLAAFEQHLEFRLSKGSYRNRDDTRLGLADIVEALIDEHGKAGIKVLFDEVIAARPEVLSTLQAHNMLIRTKLLTDASTPQHA